MMTSQVELTETFADRSERSGSAGSVRSMSSEKGPEPVNYKKMNLDQLIKAADELDISAFDRTRLFNPRKQRSCHKRSEPVSEEHRKMESSRNSREYTKRNRDEIATCKVLLNNICELRCRFVEVITELRFDSVASNMRAAAANCEKIFSLCFNFNSDMKQKLNIPSVEEFLVEYRKNVEDAMLFDYRPSSPNTHKEKLVELREQLEKLIGDKNQMNSSKDKTNYASSKSRLNQRIVREQLKSNCWDCWNDINTMIIRGEKLQKHFNQLKKEIWNNVLGIYCHLLDLSRHRPVGQEYQEMKRIEAYFAPFSSQKYELLVKLVPPEVEIIEQDVKPSTPEAEIPETKPDRLSPVPRPDNMDMTQMLRPQFTEKLKIQESTSPPLPSPSFTLTLPTVPADLATVLVNQQMKANSIVKEVEEATERKIVDLMAPSQLQKRSSPTRDEVVEKRPKIEEVEAEFATDIQQIAPSFTLPLNSTVPQIIPTSQPIPTIPNPLFSLPLQYLNTVPVPPAPIEMSPALLQAMEQQRIMAAFLNHAFRQK